MSEAEAGQEAAGQGAGVLGVGIATLDIVNEVEVYPSEDAEVRALAQRRVRGGNVTNSLVVLSQLGRACAWAGTLGDDPASGAILADLERYGIDTRLAVRHPGCSTPTSFVALSRETGSRTILHYRDLPELTAADLEGGLADADGWLERGFAWVHFEGRSPEDTAAMVRLVRERLPGARISVELEKVRPGGERLLDGPDLLLFSRAYARALGATDPIAFLAGQGLRSGARHCVLAWGEQGAYGWTRGVGCAEVPAYPPPRVVDTLGAGDVFNAGVIDGLLRGLALPDVLARANRLAGHKCGRQGFAGLAESAAADGFR
jgi:ketohexokinase